MAAIEGALPEYTTPLDALEGGFPGAVSTLTVPLSAGFIDGVLLLAESTTFTQAGGSEFSRDLVSVEPADGTITVTAGTDTADQTSASAVKPTLPAGEVELYTALVDDTTLVIEAVARGTGLVADPVLSVILSPGSINVDGTVQHIARATVVFTASSSTEFARDLVSVDPSDGVITVTAGTETSDQTEASAVTPDVPADGIGLFYAVVDDTGVTSVETSVRGSEPPVSS